MKAVLISLCASLALSASCASSNSASSEAKGGREVGGVPPEPNTTIFRAKVTSDLTADQYPAMKPILEMIDKGFKDDTVCAVRKYQDTLVFGGDVAPYVRVVFRSGMRNIIDELKKELDLNQVEIISGGPDDCRTQLTEEGSFTEESSRSLIEVLQTAKVPFKNQSSAGFPSYFWTTSLACTLIRDPKANSPFPQVDIDCTFGVDGEARKVLDQMQAKLLVNMARVAGAHFTSPSQDSNGRYINNVQVALVTCHQSEMELVGAPNGAPFSRRTIATCTMKP